MENTFRYNLDDVNRIKLSGFDFELPQKTQDLIMSLSRLVGSPDYIKTPTFQKKKRDPNEPDWDLIKQFKPTAKVDRSDNEEIIQDIKRAMNKMTDKNYDILLVDIVTGLEKLEDTEEFNLVLDIIFNLASSNRFYSKVYANLYKDLMEKYSDIFTSRMKNELASYVSRFTLIKNVDANHDYEAFCDNNKKNEELKALTEFFVNLTLMDIISIEKMHLVFNDIMELVDTYIQDEEKKHSVVELSENIFIFINTGATCFSESGHFSNMISRVERISKMKIKEHPGLSNKSLFRFMDVIDIKI